MALFCWNCSPLFGERPRVRRISTSSFLDVASTLHAPSSTATHSKHDSVVPSNRAWHFSQSRVRSLIYWFSTVDSNRVLKMQNLQETMRLSKDIGSDYALFRRVFNRFFFCIFNTIWFDSRRDSAKKRLRDTSICDFFPTTVHPANWPALLPLKPPNVDTPSLQWFQIVRTFWWERERYEHSSMKIGEYQLVAYNIHILKGSISALSGPSTPNSPINGSSKCSYVRKAVGNLASIQPRTSPSKLDR